MYSVCNCYSKPKNTKLLGMFISIVKLKLGLNTKTVNETFTSYGVSYCIILARIFKRETKSLRVPITRKQELALTSIWVYDKGLTGF